MIGAKISPRISGPLRKALRVSLCLEGFLFVHVVMNTFLRINRCFVGVLGQPTPKAKCYHRFAPGPLMEAAMQRPAPQLGHGMALTRRLDSLLSALLDTRAARAWKPKGE